MGLFSRDAMWREPLVRAAARLFALQGYEGVTMTQLAAAARCSTPTLYRLFDSKAALARAVREEGEAQLLAPLELELRLLHEGLSFEERFRCLWRAWGEVSDRYPWHLLFWGAHWHPVDAVPPVEGAGPARLVQVLAEFVARGAGEGEAGSLPGVAPVSLVLGTFLHLLQRRARREIVMSVADYEAVGEALWCALRPLQAASAAAGGAQAARGSLERSAEKARGATAGGESRGAPSSCSRE